MSVQMLGELLMPLLGTTLGAACVFFVKGQLPRSVQADISDIENHLAERAIAAAEANMAQMNMENTEIIDKWIDFSIIDTYTLNARAVIEFAADIAVTRQYLEDN